MLTLTVLKKTPKRQKNLTDILTILTLLKAECLGLLTPKLLREIDKARFALELISATPLFKSIET